MSHSVGICSRNQAKMGHLLPEFFSKNRLVTNGAFFGARRRQITRGGRGAAGAAGAGRNLKIKYTIGDLGGHRYAGGVSIRCRLSRFKIARGKRDFQTAICKGESVSAHRFLRVKNTDYEENI